MDTETENGGLSSEEDKIMSLLVDAWNLFLALPTDGVEVDEFRQAIHDAQDCLGRRVLRRLYPDYWR